MRKIITGKPLNENFSRAFDYYVIQSHKTQQDIADYIGVSKGTVSFWRKGTHLPDMETLQRLADYLNAPISQFFEFTALQRERSQEAQELIEIIEKLSTEDINVLLIVAKRLMS